ncbi:MAG: UvrD-helicase domain-containing protein [Acidobacteriaceae bacterium]
MAKPLPFLPLFDEHEDDQHDGAGQFDEADTPVQPIRLDVAAPSQPPDAESRAHALDIRRSFIVEAPAGSGKTGLLIQRFLKLLASDSVTSPEQVLALTFTLKATAEMRDRVLERLTAAAKSSASSATAPPTRLLSLAAVAEPAPLADDFNAETHALALAVLARDRQLGWALLDHPQRLNIRTIDSVCAEIARALPVLSGGGGRLTPIEDSGPLHCEAARRTLLLLGGGDSGLDSALRTLLLHNAGDLARCESLLAEMLSLREQWGDLIPLQRAHLDDAWLDENLRPRLERALDHAICATLSEAASIFPSNALNELSGIAAELAHADGYNGDDSPIAACMGLSDPPEAVAEHLDRWKALAHLLLIAGGSYRKERGITGKNLGFEYDRRHRRHLRFAAIIEDIQHRGDLALALDKVRALPPARYPEDQWRVAKALFRLLNRALVELQLVFAERNQCDFPELSLLARHALTQDSGAEDLAAALGARLQHLLVDEMQDTSAGQYELLELLTANWDGHSQTVFLVGDPRQSIYLFRQARVERFVSASNRGRLGELPLTPLRLSANFRSQKTLVDQFNIDFPQIFTREDRGPNTDPDTAPDTGPAPTTLPYRAADATLPASPGVEGIVWHINPIPGARASDDPAAMTPAQVRQQQARRDACEIRHIARQWSAKPLPEGRRTVSDEFGVQIPEPWRIAVLVRSRTHLHEIVAALKQKGSALPFRAVDIETLNERQEVLDLTALTRALLHPADRVAALAVLRAPWCGLTLADLHTLTGSGDSSLKQHSIQRLIAERGHLLPDDSIQRLTRVWMVLQALTAQRARLTTAQLVERAWRSLGGDAWLTPAELTNARRFFELLDTLEAEAPDARIEPGVLKHRLEDLFAEPEPVPAATPFVELLTIHKAKGLEWDVVFIPALERAPAVSRTRLLAWSEIGSPEDSGENAAHIMLAPIRGVGEEAKALNTWLGRLHRAREAAESKRLFYVACTRARQELHLFAAPEVSVKGKVNPRWDSLLRAAWPVAQPLVQHILGTAAGLDSDDEDTGDASASSFTAPPQPLVLDLAASAGGYYATIQRLPPAFNPEARFAAARARRLTHADSDSASPSVEPFARPEGSLSARSFGNAVHAFLEAIAARLASGTQAAALEAELPSWMPRIAAVLRAEGLPPNTVDRLTRGTRAALENSLRDPHGLWLLSPHPGAASELGLTAWLDAAQEPPRPASIRVDRIFLAGSEPHALGAGVLWIVDYKTADHGPSGLDNFLAAQRTAYAPQLETYARVLTHAPLGSGTLPSDVRVALYYPTIPRLIWWKPTPSQPPTHNPQPTTHN